MKAQTILETQNYDTWSASLDKVEIASDYSRAILTIPLMHVGANKKGLFWTDKMLKEVVPLFQNTAFRYDLNGQEGSSHTTNKLSSPHFDVGWTYSGEDGAWYDKERKTLWVKGEVTHPEVVQKLARKTTDGKREVNFASMGIIVEEAVCSICGAEYGSCKHERMQEYHDKIAYKVPVKCSKGLHVALTNDPADGEAEIKDCIFQELGENKMIGQDYRQQAGAQNENINNQMEGGLAPSSPQTAQPGMAPSPEEVLKNLAERLVTVEQKLNEKQMANETPELVNAAPQDQLVQTNMGVTSQFENTEEPKMDVKDGQAKNEKTPVNPTETQDGVAPVDPMGQVMQMLQQILAKLGGTETQDMGKEAQDANKGMIKHDETKPTEHQAPGEAVNDPGDEGNKKNKENMNKPGSVATADDVVIDTKKNVEVADQSVEVADLKKQVQALKAKLEIQDTNDVQEFGGTSQPTKGTVDVADMTAAERRETYGEYGSFDAIFNGAESASRFKR